MHIHVRKALSAATLLLSLALPASASSLTNSQIQALEGLLSSFNVPQATITTVDHILRGVPTTVTATGGTTGGGGGYTFTKPLTVGSTGTDVSELQKLLKAQGYFSYPSITTYYGPATAAAVAAFQKAHHIEAIGGVGPLTRNLLNQLESQQGSTANTTPTQTVPKVAIPSSGGKDSPVPTGGGGGGGGGGSSSGGSSSSGGGSSGGGSSSTSSSSSGTSSSGSSSSGGSASSGSGTGTPTPATPTWQNASFTTQSGTFTASFDATPNQNNADIVIGLSAAPAAAYADLATIVRFNAGGTLDVRDGTGYAFGVAVPYAANTSYHVREVVNITAHTYSVYVTPQGGTETLLASSYSFRTEQAAVASLANYGTLGDPGTATIQNFTVTAAPVTPPPPTPTGSSCPKGSAYQDGCANAPLGTPQLPNLLSSYTTRPPWNVAGVEYAVGPQTTPTKDPSTINIAGVSVNGATKQITISGNNITLDGYNFNFGGATWGVNVNGSNDTISNSYFLLNTTSTAGGFIGGTGSNMTLIYDTMDGIGAGVGSPNPGSSLISGAFTGVTTLKYNWFKNFQQHVLEYNGSGSLVYEYNLVENGGGTGTGGAHLNYLQFGVSSTGPAVTATVEFNTTYQPTVPASGGQGFQFYGGNINATFAYNSMMYSPNGDGVPQVSSNGGYPGTTNAQVHDNYIDRKGGGGYFYPDSSAGTSDSYSNNFDMPTGHLITVVVGGGGTPSAAAACPKGSAYADGCSTAPAGSPQLPSLLSGYTLRAPWNVAGVDYAVGPQYTPYKDPATINMPGVTVDNTTRSVNITGDNVTLDGYDFSLHGGYSVLVGVYGSGANATISNCNFLLGPTQNAGGLIGGIAANVTIKYCTLDQTGPGSGIPGGNPWSIITGNFTGTTTLEYSWLKNFSQHVLEMGGSGALVYKYNLIENGAWGVGSHLNYLQFGGNTFGPVTVEYNTTYQPTTPVAGGEGFQFYTNGTGSVSPMELAYNTQVYGPGGEGVIHISSNVQYQSTSGTIHDNYIDKRAGGGFYYPDSKEGVTDFYSNNIDLASGRYITGPSTVGSLVGGSTTPPPPPPPSPPADTTPPVITITAPSGTLAAGTTQATLSVTTNENATCAYSPSAGAAFASMIAFATTGGTAHSATLSNLSDGSSYITYVKCKDAAGNISADSSTSYSVAQPAVGGGGTGGGAAYSGPGDVVPGAIAWWGLRGYSAAMSDGAHTAATIRRTSDNTTADIKILATGAFDTASASSFCSSTTCYVSKLFDQSGHGNDIAQVAAANQPQLMFNCVGSLPCMVYAGNQYLSSTASVTQVAPDTFSVVVERTGNVTGQQSIVYSNGGNGKLVFLNAANQVCMYGGSWCLSSAASDNVLHSIQSVFQDVSTGVSSTLTIDGATVTGNTGPGGLSNTVLVGAGNGENLTGNLMEAGIWGGGITNVQQSSMNSNQHTYWGF